VEDSIIGPSSYSFISKEASLIDRSDSKSYCFITPTYRTKEKNGGQVSAQTLTLQCIGFNKILSTSTKNSKFGTKKNLEISSNPRRK
jgi:hypothetical protein